MNGDNSLLVIFSMGFAGVMVCMIVLPAMAKKQELLGAWSLFLAGAAIFTGLSGLNAAKSGFRWAEVQSIDYQLFYVGAVVFFGSAALAYYVFKTPRRLAGKVWMKWPQMTPTWMSHAALIMLGVAVSRFFVIPIPLIAQLQSQVGRQAPIIAVVLAMVAWWRAKSSTYTLIVLLLTLAFMPLATIAIGGSRRFLLSGLVSIPLVIYWLDLRYRTVSTRFFWIALAIGLSLPVLMGYSALRHKKLDGGQGSPVARATAILKELPNAILRGGSSEGLSGQNSAEVGISLIHLCRTRSPVVQPTPFFTLYYIAVNPIPRIIWPEKLFGGPKPEGLGHTLPRDLGVYRTGGYVNWGVNVIGKCYFDGGLYVHALYGLIVGFFLRFADEILIRKPGNPFVLSILACSSSQIIAWTRGSIAGFSIQIMGALLSVLVATIILRIISGVGHIDPRTDHIDDPRDVDAAMRGWPIGAR